MDYTQERVATLHDFGDADPSAPTDRTAVVVPMTDRDAGGLAAERVFASLATLDVARVVVPVRAPGDRIGSILDWLDGFDLPLRPVWCNGPELESFLADRGLAGEAGKGRDVWLGAALAGDADYIALHDADVTSHESRDLRKLVAPLAGDHSFVKGFYARVENRRLYGRLYRLLYAPLVAALTETHDAPLLSYLSAFRYALAGELAMTADLARSIRMPRRWGLEVGTLGAAFETVGFTGSAQVDLGRYEHEHRAVSGPNGLSAMAAGVAESLLRVVEDGGVVLDYGTLPDRYRSVADRFVRQYRADARFNDLTFDESDERRQVETYAAAVAPPGEDDRLPAWEEATIDEAALRAAIEADVNRVQ
ncbi:MAG: glycosyl transferase family 2 [Halanaeroarchaeum sp.]